MYWPELGSMSNKFAALDTCAVIGYYDTAFFARPEELDPENPLESLAAASIGIGPTLDHDTHTKIAHFEYCRDWDIDGIICYESRTCRLASGPEKDALDYINKRLGLPVTFLGGDFVEDAYYNEAQWDTRIQALLEVIDSRRSRN